MIMDESTDCLNRKVLNVLVSPLECGSKPRLLQTKILKKCDADTIVQEAVNSMMLLGLDLKHLVVLITDNAPYMISAGQKLSIICTRYVYLYNISIFIMYTYIYLSLP
jgi:hypothetical protein